MISASEPRPGQPWRARGVTAVLGPTNTGKTHLAIERMLGHSSGVIGLPLRLLAREVYNRVVARVGEGAAALVTGEEKIKPRDARYWVCTVEAMPRDLDVAFTAVDEIQLAADFDRGHVFTDRLLHARGREETLLLGAATMRPMIERLLPGVSVVTRPRLSNLSYAGDKKITRLPARSAIVAFSAEEVYEIAELIRRQRGGAAVVLGALSPRTRNAQVALYQSGDVDFLVATDAIGMGLNLDVDHVAFASLRKFDGHQFRNLNPAELGQIAGRAGRHVRDGTFGVTGRVEPFEAELAHALESHEFEPLKVLQWRNSRLDMTSLESLRASLAELPQEPGLTRAPIGEDALVLDMAARDAELTRLAARPGGVTRLWEACQVPDYRKSAPAAHADLVFTLYRHLMSEGTIPTDWLAGQIAYADRTDGDIDTLSARIAHVRTWTFVANRPDWLADPEHWQGIARGVEDKLSDALHERLAQRFVDRRTSVLMRRLRENAMLEAEINAAGDVLVEGQHVGHLAGFRFAPDASAEAIHGKALRTAAQKALTHEIERRATRLGDAPDAAILISSDGHLRWEGEPVARLTAGERLLQPGIALLADSELTGPQRDRVAERLQRWFDGHRRELLKPLLDLEAAEGLDGMARGLAFQVVEGLGILERARVVEDVRGLDQAARAKLRGLGLRFGAHHLFVPLLLKPGPRALLALLWGLKHGHDLGAVGALASVTASGRTSMAIDPAMPVALYPVLGYRVAGSRAVRVDMLERLADVIRPAFAWRPGAAQSRPEAALAGGFRVTGAMTSLLGCSGEDFSQVLRSLGYRAVKRVAPRAELEAWRLPVPAPVARAEPAPSEAEPQAAPQDASSSSEVDISEESPEARPEVLPEVELPAGAMSAETLGIEVVGGLEDDAPDLPADADVPANETLALQETMSADLPAGSEPSEGQAPSPPEPGEDRASDVEETVLVEVAAGDTLVLQETAASHPAEEPAPASAEPKADEPVEVEVWYPSRRLDERRPRPEARSRRETFKARAGRRDAEAPVEGGTPPAEGEARADRPPREERRPRRDDAKRGERPRPERPRFGKDERPRPGGEERRPPRGDDRRPPPRPERAPDPNSPFAALASLKADLEARSKRDG